MKAWSCQKYPCLKYRFHAIYLQNGMLNCNSTLSPSLPSPCTLFYPLLCLLSLSSTLLAIYFGTEYRYLFYDNLVLSWIFFMEYLDELEVSTRKKLFLGFVLEKFLLYMRSNTHMTHMMANALQPFTNHDGRLGYPNNESRLDWRSNIPKRLDEFKSRQCKLSLFFVC